jgi:hypothetical protein
LTVDRLGVVDDRFCFLAETGLLHFNLKMWDFCPRTLDIRPDDPGQVRAVSTRFAAMTAMRATAGSIFAKPG